MKVVIDTNIWISYLLGNLLQDLDEKILTEEVKIIVSVDYLVTGDEDIIVLNPFHNIKIIKPKEFGKVLRRNLN